MSPGICWPNDLSTMLLGDVLGVKHCAGFQGPDEKRSDMDKTYGLSPLLQNPQGNLVTHILNLCKIIQSEKQLSCPKDSQDRSKCFSRYAKIHHAQW